MLWLGVITAPLGLGLLGLYGARRASGAPELELIIVNLLILLMILFPRLRSKLVRRRVWVRAWIRRGHWLRELLRGGALYLSIQLLLLTPVSLLLLVELQHISRQFWYQLIGLGAVCALARLLIHRRFANLLTPAAASVISREWTVYLFLAIASPLLFNEMFYTERPDLSQYTLSEALLMSARALPPQRGGFLNELIFLSAMKETGLWWSLMQLPSLKGLPASLTWLASQSLMGLYSLYQLSVLFALSQYFAGFLELVDPQCYRFLRGSPATPSGKPLSTSTHVSSLVEQKTGAQDE